MECSRLVTCDSPAQWGASINAPVVSIAADAATSGYWMVGSDGGVFAFHSSFDGSDGSDPRTAPVEGIVASPGGYGYWMVGETGAVSAFGRANFEGAIDGTLPATDPPASNGVHGSKVVAIAEAQVGQTDPFLYGPIGTSWCAYFASWVYEHAGIRMPAFAPSSKSGNGRSTTGAGSCPRLRPHRSETPSCSSPPGARWHGLTPPGLNYPNIEHVNIVVAVLPGGGIITVGGNESGAVREQGPYSAADASSWWGQAIYAFVQPPGV